VAGRRLRGPLVGRRSGRRSPALSWTGRRCATWTSASWTRPMALSARTGAAMCRSPTARSVIRAP